MATEKYFIFKFFHILKIKVRTWWQKTTDRQPQYLGVNRERWRPLQTEQTPLLNRELTLSLWPSLRCRNVSPYCQVFKRNQKSCFMWNPFIFKSCFQILKNTVQSQKQNLQAPCPSPVYKFNLILSDEAISVIWRCPITCPKLEVSKIWVSSIYSTRYIIYHMLVHLITKFTKDLVGVRYSSRDW